MRRPEIHVHTTATTATVNNYAIMQVSIAGVRGYVSSCELFIFGLLEWHNSGYIIREQTSAFRTQKEHQKQDRWDYQSCQEDLDISICDQR